MPADAQGDKKKGLALLPYLMGTSTFDFGVCDRGQLAFESTADIRGVGLVVRPPFAIDPLLTLEGAFRAAVRISERPERAEEVVLLGSAGGSRLAIQGQAITWFAQNPTGALDLGFEAQLQAIRLVLGGGDGDGFLQKVLSGLDVHAEASLTVGMTLLTGLTVQGSGQLAVDVSTHVDLGPVQIDSLRLALAPADDQHRPRSRRRVARAARPAPRQWSRTSACGAWCVSRRAISGPPTSTPLSSRRSASASPSTEASSRAEGSSRSTPRKGAMPVRCSSRSATSSP